MGIKANFTIKDFENDLSSKIQRIVNASVQAMGYLGMKCVNYARTVPAEIGFTDRTGNLRSSIGFKVFNGGTAVQEDYKQVLDGAEGMKSGKALADSVGAMCGEHQIMLVVTAGMDYAIYVESKGRDVITGSELLAEREWPQMKQRIDEIIRRQMQ